MNILLLGRDGQLGTVLCGVLPALGNVEAVGRAGADLAHPEAVAALVRDKRPDVIVNAAAYTAVDRAESEAELAETVNARAVGAVAAAAADIGATLVHYSTDYVFDGEGSRPHEETDPTAPINVYGRSKRNGEIAITEASPRHVILRTSWVHAPGGRNFVTRMLELAAEREELQVVDDQIGAPTSARLIAEVTASVLQRNADGRPVADGIYHLAAAGETSWAGLARHVIDHAIGRGARLKMAADKVLPVPSSVWHTPARRPLNSRLSTQKLREALGLELPHWTQDVEATVDAMVPERSV